MTREEAERIYPDIRIFRRNDETFWIMVEAMHAHDTSRTPVHHAGNLSQIIAEISTGDNRPLVEIVTERHGYPLDVFNLDYLESKRTVQ
jgi:hypothetical protein